MKKKLLNNPDQPAYFIYGGLFLIFLNTTLQIGAGGLSGKVMLIISALLIVAGFCGRFYQAKQNNTLKSFFGGIAFALTMVIGLMVTGIIRTPAFLQDIF